MAAEPGEPPAQLGGSFPVESLAIGALRRRRPCPAERSEERGKSLGTTKEVLGVTIELAFNWAFLGFPMLVS